MKHGHEKRLRNVKIKYGKINIENKKFIVPILELLRESNTYLGNKKTEIRFDKIS
jgi:hypothetical protein